MTRRNRVRIIAAMMNPLASDSSLAGWLVVLRERGPVIVAGVAALLLGFQIAALVSDFAGASNRPLPTAAEAGYTAPPPRDARTRVDLGSMVSAHLFGESRAAAGAGSTAPQTSMPLVLAGVLASDDPQTGFAIVGESAAGARFFPVGASLPGGPKLHAVYPDRIVIDRSGTLESLSLPKRALSSAAPSAALQPAPLPGADLGERMRAAVQQNPSALSNVLRAQQVMANGKQRGFRVYPGANPGAFSRLGLRPGDLITAVNGTPLDDPSQGDEILKTLGSAPEVRVTLMRNGRPTDLVLDMTRLASEAEQIVGTEGMQPVDQAAAVPPPPQ